MRTMNCATLAAILAILAMTTGRAQAYIKPELQPDKLANETYQSAIGTKIIERDADAHTMTLKVTDVFTGTFKPETITVTTTDDTRDEPIFLDDGQLIAAYVSNLVDEDQVYFYTGGGIWQEAEIVDGDRSKWKWTVVHDEQTIESMFGTFNGDATRLVEMMQDLKRGEYYFPARPFQRYSQVVVGAFDKPLRGVALYDVDGDGDLDAYGCSAAGNRLYLQDESLEFTDATAKLGLDGIAGASCSFADANADGRADLLADGVIYTQGDDGTFSKTTWLPAGAGEALKSSAFVELNGDGYPDVVVSQVDRGLHAYLNPGKDGGAFEHATGALGLSKEACGATGTGFFTPGDWNTDGRTDLYYGAGRGLLLIQAKDGTFTPGSLGLDLSAFGEGAGMTGAGAFAPLWRNDSPSLLVPMDASFALFATIGGRLANVITATNELENEPAEQQISVLCEDLDADGYVDIYTGTRGAGCNYHCNRGYGSFMHSNKYTPEAFPKAFNTGAWGLAAGDANGDGANDILLGGVDGTLALLVNETLSLRTPPKADTTHHPRKRYNTTILAIDVKGPIGVVGAKLVLKDADKRVVATRRIGNNVNVGSCSSGRVNLAVREDGEYVLTVTWSDGTSRDVTVEVGEQRRMAVTVERPKADCPQ
ncbi:MAG: VCBS repeat-containing protein [Phycisphaerae bacterium]|nr:VCBS repeat-containing protein [Phycisphaerae bacterium]